MTYTDNYSKTVKVLCKNTNKYYTIPTGTTLMEFAKIANVKIRKKTSCKALQEKKREEENYPILAALVDHKLKELSYRILTTNEIEFVGYQHPDGQRTYLRSLCFVLQNAVKNLFPDKVLVIDHSLPSGLYCEICETTKLEDGRYSVYFVTDKDLSNIRKEMLKIIAQDLPFLKGKMSVKDAAKLFIKNAQPDKAELQLSLGRFLCTVYSLDGQIDTFHGPLLPSSGYLKVFDLLPFSNGFCLQFPSYDNFNEVIPMKRQSKIAATLKEYSDWCCIMGVNGIGTLNRAVLGGQAVNLINLAEALHEKKYAEIAQEIYSLRSRIKVVFIAGPSSSGKTSSSLRLALHCKVLGLNPKVLELDNYFVDREHTPRDENGDYDFESLRAMDLKLLNKQLNALLQGEEVEIPRFDFKNGERVFEGNMMKLEEKDILIMEGIHALNPDMIADVDNSRVFRVYASALTSLNVDENNNISTSDNRLLRRIVRDNRVRGITPEQTINRWHSVRRGENRNIFPYQENADAAFNSALIFELPMLKYYAEPLLRRIAPSSPAYTEAVRLLKFLDYIVALSPDEIAAIPPTSIMREFIGGQTLKRDVLEI